METEGANDKTNTIETTTTTPKPTEEKEKKDCNIDPRTWFLILCFFFVATIIMPVCGAVVSSDAYEFVDAPQGQCKPKSIKKWDCSKPTGTRSGGRCSGEASRYEYSVKSNANDSIRCREVYKENYCSCGSTPDPEYEGTEWATCWISDCSDGGYTFSDPEIKIKTGNILFIMTAPFGVIMITIFCYLICYIPRQEVKRKRKQKR
eukprot:163362_1